MTYEILIALGILGALAITFLVYWSKAHTAFKMLTLVSLLVLGTFSINFYYKMLGAPVPIHPGEEFFLVHYIVTPDEKILIWVYYQENDGHRLHVIPYDRETAKALEEAQQGNENGQPSLNVFESRSNSVNLISRPFVSPGNTEVKRPSQPDSTGP